MRRSRWVLRRLHTIRTYASSTIPRPPIIKIEDGTFYRRQPSTIAQDGESLSNKPLFPNLNFTFPADNVDKQYWAIVGPSNAGKSTLLEILRGQHLCWPPNARSYPYLSTDEIAAKDARLRYSGHAIQFVGFSNKDKGLSGFGTYISARYESRREVTDFSLLNYLEGKTELNAEVTDHVDEKLLAQVMKDLNLTELAEMPVSNLSNGQTRRARIAKALLGKPELLLLDEPFMGLDPKNALTLSALLAKLAESSNPRLLLTLRPQDPIPTWINNVLFLGRSLEITHQGSVKDVKHRLQSEVEKLVEEGNSGKINFQDVPYYYQEFGAPLDDSIYTATKTVKKRPTREELAESKAQEADVAELGTVLSEPLIEMDGVIVKYGDRAVIGGGKQTNLNTQETKEEAGLFWTVRRGERWGVFGPNGSGKTTLLSMITSDHPQAYSSPMKILGRPRLAQPGIPGLSIFELQSRIGLSSPEVHAFFPRTLSVRATLESAYADTPLSRPLLDAEADRRVDACLRWFQGELNPSAGMNTKLKDELLRTEAYQGKDYVKDPLLGNIEPYLAAKRQYWYEHNTTQSESIEWADKMIFGELSFSAQRVALFLRAIVKAPDLVVLDEAFSGMDEYVRDKCMLFLFAGEYKRLSPQQRGTREWRSTYVPVPRSPGEIKDAVIEGMTKQQALICVSHVKEEVPLEVRSWLYLPEAGTKNATGTENGPRLGHLKRGQFIRSTEGTWRTIWHAPKKRFRRKGSNSSDEEES